MNEDGLYVAFREGLLNAVSKAVQDAETWQTKIKGAKQDLPRFQDMLGRKQYEVIEEEIRLAEETLEEFIVGMSMRIDGLDIHLNDDIYD